MESSVRLTRMVSPIPSASRVPIPTADLIAPVKAVPASVTPRWNGYGTRSASMRYASIIILGSEDFRETFISG